MLILDIGIKTVGKLMGAKSKLRTASVCVNVKPSSGVSDRVSVKLPIASQDECALENVCGMAKFAAVRTSV